RSFWSLDFSAACMLIANGGHARAQSPQATQRSSPLSSTSTGRPRKDAGGSHFSSGYSRVVEGLNISLKEYHSALHTSVKYKLSVTEKSRSRLYWSFRAFARGCSKFVC